MKTLLTSVCFGLFLFCTMGCQKEGKGEQKTFGSAEEAANQAKADLLQALRSARDVNLGVTAADLEKAQPAPAVPRYQVTFEQLAGDPAAAFTPNEQQALATVVPLVADNRVVTVAEVRPDGDGWRVAGLAGRSTADELNIVRGVSGPQQRVTIYELPHSGARVYGVQGPEGQVFHTNYPGFELRQPVQPGQLGEVLRRDAAEFQRLHAEDLKRQRLVR